VKHKEITVTQISGTNDAPRQIMTRAEAENVCGKANDNIRLNNLEAAKLLPLQQYDTIHDNTVWIIISLTYKDAKAYTVANQNGLLLFSTAFDMP
jgi:hypothetical protein